MHILLQQSSLRQELDPAYHTTNRTCSSHCRFDNPQSQRGTPVQKWSVTQMEDVLGKIGYIRLYPCGVMFWRDVSHLQSNYNCRAQNWVQRGAFSGHLLIGLIRFWSCPVHALDVDVSMILFVGKAIQPAESGVWTELDAIDSIVWSTFDTCCTIQLLSILSPPHFPHSNYLRMSLCRCWIMGRGEIRLGRVYRFFVGRISRWWCILYIVYE